jgi:NAD(P)H-hydrate epimerase
MGLMKHVTAAQMKAIDRTAIEKYGVPAATLMENAGTAVVAQIAKSIKPCETIVVAGYGNNGGDGFVIARLLLKMGFKVNVLLAGRPRPFGNETGDNFKALLDSGCAPRAIYDAESMEKAFAAMPGCELIIDALFGIGIKGPLDRFYIALIEKINVSGANIVAVDLPSGLDADKGTPCPSAVKASKTITFGLPKAGFKNEAAKPYIGEVIVADIGIPSEAVDDALKMGRKDL